MSELERQLLRALQSLAAQYKREQERQAALVDGLSEQVTRLSEQVTSLSRQVEPLAKDYKALAGDYRKIASALARR